MDRVRRLSGRQMTTLQWAVWPREQVKPVQAGAEDVDVAAEDVSVASLRPEMV